VRLRAYSFLRVCVDAPCISFRTSKTENRCTISEHVEDWEERLDVFLEKSRWKNGGQKTWRCDSLPTLEAWSLEHRSLNFELRSALNRADYRQEWQAWLHGTRMTGMVCSQRALHAN
jgi:hypothetical protein